MFSKTYSRARYVHHPYVLVCSLKLWIFATSLVADPIATLIASLNGLLCNSSHSLSKGYKPAISGSFFGTTQQWTPDGHQCTTPELWSRKAKLITQLGNILTRTWHGKHLRCPKTKQFFRCWIITLRPCSLHMSSYLHWGGVTLWVCTRWKNEDDWHPFTGFPRRCMLPCPKWCGLSRGLAVKSHLMHQRRILICGACAVLVKSLKDFVVDKRRWLYVVVTELVGDETLCGCDHSIRPST